MISRTNTIRHNYATFWENSVTSFEFWAPLPLMAPTSSLLFALPLCAPVEPGCQKKMRLFFAFQRIIWMLSMVERAIPGRGCSPVYELKMR